MATVVAIITTIVVANATQAITTPNAAFISYSLAAGANSAPITPVTNRSVLIMGCCTTQRGTGHVSLIHGTSPASGMAWTGVESPYAFTTTIASGFAVSGGTHIVYIDGDHQVDIRSASADTILIHNITGSTQTGNVTLVW